MGIAVPSPTTCEFLLEADGPENNGAGGRGLLGLPLYRDEGVPGRGLPLISCGSYATLGGGGLENSVELREGVHGRVGDTRPVGCGT